MPIYLHDILQVLSLDVGIMNYVTENSREVVFFRLIVTFSATYRQVPTIFDGEARPAYTNER